jgi:hypothetical protein
MFKTLESLLPDTLHSYCVVLISEILVSMHHFNAALPTVPLASVTLEIC